MSIRKNKITPLVEYDFSEIKIERHYERYYKLIDNNQKLIVITLYRIGAENVKQLLESLDIN